MNFNDIDIFSLIPPQIIHNDTTYRFKLWGNTDGSFYASYEMENARSISQHLNCIIFKNCSIYKLIIEVLDFLIDKEYIDEKPFLKSILYSKD